MKYSKSTIDKGTYKALTGAEIIEAFYHSLPCNAQLLENTNNDLPLGTLVTNNNHINLIL